MIHRNDAQEENFEWPTASGGMWGVQYDTQTQKWSFMGWDDSGNAFSFAVNKSELRQFANDVTYLVLPGRGSLGAIG